MPVDPCEDEHQAAWWGVQVEQLRIVRTTAMMLKQTGIHVCQDFQNWSAPELRAWAGQNAVNVTPVLRIVAEQGIRLAPDERPDWLVRLLLAPASHAGRQAAIEYYGLLGQPPRSLQAMGAETPTQQRLLKRRLAEARPRLSTLTRLAPQLVPALNTAIELGSWDPAHLAAAIAPWVGDGKTLPAHFAHFLLDVVSSQVIADTPFAPNLCQQESDTTHAFSAEGADLQPLVVETNATAKPTWLGAPIEHLGLRALTTNLLKQTGIHQCDHLTTWTREELEFWAEDNYVTVSPLMRALEEHAIPLASSDPPDCLVRLLLAPLDHAGRQAVISNWGLLSATPRRVEDLAATYQATYEVGRLMRARARLQHIKHLPFALEPLMLTAARHLKDGPEQLAAIITPLLGRGQTVPLHLAQFLLDIVPPLRRILPRAVSQRTANGHGLPDRIQQEPPSPTTRLHVNGQRAERARAATDLIDLLFGEDQA